MQLPAFQPGMCILHYRMHSHKELTSQVCLKSPSTCSTCWRNGYDTMDNDKKESESDSRSCHYQVVKY